MYRILLVFLYWLTMSTFVCAQQDDQEFTNSEDLKTVLLYAFTRGERAELRYVNPPVADLNNAQQHIVLEFDDLRARYAQYKVRIVHCNTQWERSKLVDMEFLSGINEFFLNEFQVSQNTKVPYYHYRFVVPKPLISGNFMLQLYEDERLVAQRKFWIYENRIHIAANALPARDPEFWKTHQQLDLKLDLSQFRIGIPHKELKVFLRFNQHQWTEVKSTDLVNTGNHNFVLQPFNKAYLFPAGNEFRYLDVSSNFSRGQNVREVIRGRPDDVFTHAQLSRAATNFVDAYDNDGGYIVSNRDGGDTDLASDYVNVYFQLDAKDLADHMQPVLYGKLTDWAYIPMAWDPDSGLLQHILTLKNGVYDFAFGLQNTATGEVDPNFFEGNFQQAGNTYEVFVYHEVPGKRFVNLVGYHMTRKKTF